MKTLAILILAFSLASFPLFSQIKRDRAIDDVKFKFNLFEYPNKRYAAAIENIEASIAAKDFHLFRCSITMALDAVETAQNLAEDYKSDQDQVFKFLDRNSEDYYLCKIVSYGYLAFESQLAEIALENLESAINSSLKKVVAYPEKMYREHAAARISAAEYFASDFRSIIEKFTVESGSTKCSVTKEETDSILVALVEYEKRLADLSALSLQLPKNPYRNSR